MFSGENENPNLSPIGKSSDFVEVVKKAGFETTSRD